jgi:hypothetical protein
MVLKTVRDEWVQAETDEQILVWAKKWGWLLCEDFQNPIWLEGFAKGKKAYTEELALEEGELEAAVEIFRSKVKILTFNVEAEYSILASIEEKQIREAAANMMADALADHITMEMEELKNGNVMFTFYLTVVRD